MPKINLKEFSSHIVFNFPDRKAKFDTGNYDVLSNYITPLASSIIGQLNENVVITKMPILSVLYLTRFANSALVLILDIIKYGLLLLSALVIYSFI